MLSSALLPLLSIPKVMIQIRPAAAQEINRLLNRQDVYKAHQPPQAYLTLEPGGCAEWTYCLTAEPPQYGTTLLDCGHNVTLAVSTAHIDLLKDITIDYSEDLMGGGFRFINPAAQRTCGCGNAFALSADLPMAEDCTLSGLPAA